MWIFKIQNFCLKNSKYSILITSPAARKFFAALASPDACSYMSTVANAHFWATTTTTMRFFCWNFEIFWNFLQWCNMHSNHDSWGLSLCFVIFAFFFIFWMITIFCECLMEFCDSFVTPDTWMAFARASLAASASAAIARWDFQSNVARRDFFFHQMFPVENIFSIQFCPQRFLFSIKCCPWRLHFLSNVARREYIFYIMLPVQLSFSIKCCP